MNDRLTMATTMTMKMTKGMIAMKTLAVDHLRGVWWSGAVAGKLRLWCQFWGGGAMLLGKPSSRKLRHSNFEILQLKEIEFVPELFNFESSLLE